jgi:hypothetical protein
MNESVVSAGPRTLDTLDDRSPSPEGPKAVEETEQELRMILCKLCGREMREITTVHLRLAHGWKEETVVERYKRTFNVESVRSSLTLATRQEVGMTEDRLKREILRIRRVGSSLNSKNMMKSHQAVYLGACEVYGSWENALSHCGIDYDAIRLRQRWTRGKVLNWIADRDLLKLDLHAGTVKRDQGGVHTAACREFGSWDAALDEAGIHLDEDGRGGRWDRESVVAGLQHYWAGLTERELRERDPALLSASVRHFGGFSRALRAAGLLAANKAKAMKWNRKSILSTIRSRMGTEIELPPRAFMDLGEFAKSSVEIFGSWDEALKAARCAD